VRIITKCKCKGAQNIFEIGKASKEHPSYINHSADDVLCRTWCNPAPTDGSAPNLVVPAVDKQGQACLK
jgi:hypothetical protein